MELLYFQASAAMRDEICSLLGCYAALPTFGDKLSVPSSGVKKAVINHKVV